MKKWKNISIVISVIIGICALIFTAISLQEPIKDSFKTYEEIDYNNLKPYAIDIAKGLTDPNDLVGDGITAYKEVEKNCLNVYVEYGKCGLEASFPVSKITKNEDSAEIYASDIDFENVSYSQYETNNPEGIILVLTFSAAFSWMISYIVLYGFPCFAIWIYLEKNKQKNNKEH